MIALILGLALATEPAEPVDPFQEPLRLMNDLARSGYPHGGTLLAVVALEQHPDHPRSPFVRLEISRFQRTNGLLSEEEHTLARGLEAHPVRWRPWFELALLDARLQRRDFVALSEAHVERAEWPTEISDAAHFYGAWGRLATGDEDGARVLLSKVRGGLQPAATEFSTALEAVPTRQRRPAIAGLLSVLPGAGHLYAGDPVGAAANALVTGGLGAGAVYFTTQDEPVLAVVLGVVGAASMATGVGDAMRASRQFNRARRDERFVGFTDRWWLQSELTDDPDVPIHVLLAPPREP